VLAHPDGASARYSTAQPSGLKRENLEVFSLTTDEQIIFALLKHSHGVGATLSSVAPGDRDIASSPAFVINIS
jgi:hypothetical protein